MLPRITDYASTLSASNMPPARTLLGFLLPLISVHLLLVKLFRQHHIRQLQRKHPYTSNPRPGTSDKHISEMPLSAAHEVVQLLASKDFPLMFDLSLKFALTRTYSIPTISTLLAKTAQLGAQSRNTVGKRYADTTVIISEYLHNAPGTTRSSEAFARLNYLHGHYLRQNKISNDDMLFTLSLFMRNPVEWIDRYEWRQLTELEIAGMGLFHRFVGEAMKIDFSPLDGYAPAPLPRGTPGNASRTWRSDGLAFFDSFESWSQAYEDRAMFAAPTNHSTTMKTLELATSTVPKALGPIVQNSLISLMDERMRLANTLPLPPPAYRICIEILLLHIRRPVLQYLCLPRRALWGWWTPQADRGPSTEHTDASGRRWLKTYESLPHYVKPTVWNRWGPAAWMAWTVGVPVPGDEGMEEQGWLMSEAGPKVFAGKGKGEFQEGVLRLKGRVRMEEAVASGPGGCPMFIKV